MTAIHDVLWLGSNQPFLPSVQVLDPKAPSSKKDGTSQSLETSTPSPRIPLLDNPTAILQVSRSETKWNETKHSIIIYSKSSERRCLSHPCWPVRLPECNTVFHYREACCRTGTRQEYWSGIKFWGEDRLASPTCRSSICREQVPVHFTIIPISVLTLPLVSSLIWSIVSKIGYRRSSQGWSVIDNR